MDTKSILKQPSAWIPLVMSLAALSLVFVHIAIFGIARQEDEGTAAHLFQLLMASQLPVVAYFALKWLPRSPREALIVLAVQCLAIIAAFTPIFLLEY